MKISTNPAAVQALQAAAQHLKTANLAALEQLAADVRLEFEMEQLHAERQRNPQGSELVSYTDLELAKNAKPSPKTWNFVYNGARMVNVTTRDHVPREHHETLGHVAFCPEAFAPNVLRQSARGFAP